MSYLFLKHFSLVQPGLVLQQSEEFKMSSQISLKPLCDVYCSCKQSSLGTNLKIVDFIWPTTSALQMKIDENAEYSIKMQKLVLDFVKESQIIF